MSSFTNWSRVLFIFNYRNCNIFHSAGRGHSVLGFPPTKFWHLSHSPWKKKCEGPILFAVIEFDTIFLVYYKRYIVIIILNFLVSSRFIHQSVFWVKYETYFFNNSGFGEGIFHSMEYKFITYGKLIWIYYECIFSYSVR